MSSTIKTKPILNGDSPKETYDDVYALGVGGVFKISSDYETVMRRLVEYKPQGLVFVVFPINPGTSLYMMYGPDHCVVVDNRGLKS